MRQITLCAMALLLLLAGCAAGGTKPEATEPYTLDDAQVLLDAGLFNGEMGEIDDRRVIAMLYDIDEDTIQDFVSYQAANTAASADELTVLILTDEEAAQAAETACRQRIDDQIEASRNYTPEAVPRLEAAVIRRADNTVLLAVGAPEQLPQAVDALHE